MGYILLIWTLKFTLGKIGKWLSIIVAQKVISMQCWRPGFNPWVGKNPWRRHEYPLQYSCLENPHGQRSLMSYCPWGQKASDMTEELSTHHIINNFWTLQLIRYGNSWAVQLPRHICFFATLQHTRLLHPPVSQSLLRFIFNESEVLSNHLILCPFSFCLQSFPSSGSF